MSPEQKKQKLEDENQFPSIGEQAQVIDADTLRRTGAVDAEGRPVQELESLCMNCHKQGLTRLLFTDIPNFRQVVVMSFQCEHCGFTSSEVQTASEMQEKGQRMTVQLTEPSDLARQVIKTEFSTCTFPELDVEIPPANGRVTTIEGILAAMRDDLSSDQEYRKQQAPEVYEKIQSVIDLLQEVLDGKKFPFRFVLDDPSGNSYVSYTPEEYGNKWQSLLYNRTPAQNRALGINVGLQDSSRNEGIAGKLEADGEIDENVPADMREEVQVIPGSCPSCQEECPTRMKMVNIPHFKDVIIMSTTCASCGYKSNEVKTGGAIPDQGRRVTLNVTDADDLSRDLLKSETCHMTFPELDLDLNPGTLGGRFTTIEGLLQQVYEELESKIFNSQLDTMDATQKERWAAFLAKLQTAIDGQLLPFTIKMEDPLAASYIQNVYAPDVDPEMTIEDYDRTEEQNEELGLTDMKV